jgi:hypothetical protein
MEISDGGSLYVRKVLTDINAIMTALLMNFVHPPELEGPQFRNL